MFQWIRKKRLLLIAGIVFPAFFLLISNKLVENASENKLFDSVSAIEKRKVGLVLGTSKKLATGQMNLYFKYRVEAAAKLFHAGRIEYILISGDNSRMDYNEPEQFKEVLVAMGVPANNIYLDYAGFRTLDSIIRANKIFGQTKFTVISQKFHNERAIYLASHFGLDVIGYNAKDVNARFGFTTNMREYFARSKAVIDVLFGTQPKFLGEKIMIE